MGGPIVLTGPDLAQGVAVNEVTDGKSLLGHANGEPVLLVRRGTELLAVGAVCSHYSGPLAEGLVVGDTIRCPLHHACFSLRDGSANGPALNPIPCYRVESDGDRAKVCEKLVHPPNKIGAHPHRVVIVGAGAAGEIAAETLRKEGFQGVITLLGAEETVPVDRPNLSKDFLAGTAPEEWLPLRPREFFAEQKIELRTGVRVVSIDAKDPHVRKLTLEGGEVLGWDSLLLATGAEPIRLTIPGAELPHVQTLRTLADTRAILKLAGKGKRAVVIGASFIGLEVAASLRTQGMDVAVVGLEKLPLERVLGAQLGQFILELHQQHGVQFHLENTAVSISADSVTLKSGEVLAADVVVVGIGVRPRLELAEQAGLAIDRGVLVDRELRTSVQHIWAAGDIARYPDLQTGECIRVEHWAAAQRQGEMAARNILEKDYPFRAVPFFWSSHYDVQINYVGHAEKFDEALLEGDLAKRDCAVTYKLNGKRLAVATIGRDLHSLQVEHEMQLEEKL